MTVKIGASPVNQCMVCRSEGSSLYKNIDDRLFGESKGWDISNCKKCGLLWLNPMPNKDEIWKAYQSYYTHSEQAGPPKLLSFLEKPYLQDQYGYHNKNDFFQKVLAKVAFLFPLAKNRFDFKMLYLPKVKGGKVLDFGCGNGWLIENYRNLGWDTYGLDFDPKSVEYCQSKGLNVKLGSVDEQNYPDDFFDAITINHVIEHVYDVEALLMSFSKVLKKNGKLIIATPNTNNWQHQYYKNYWFQLDTPRHLHLFNNNNLEILVKRSGFAVEKSFSSIRMDAWSTIVSRGIKRRGSYKVGIDKKTKLDLMIGLSHQVFSAFLSIFNNKLGNEVILIATKK